MDPAQAIIDAIIADTGAERQQSIAALNEWFRTGGYKPALSDVLRIANAYPLDHTQDIIDEALRFGAVDDRITPSH